MSQQPIVTPRITIWTWSVSVLAGAMGLGLGYGFREPVVAEETVRLTLAASLGLFALGRLLMLLPPSAIGARLRRWWVDYVLLIAAAIWWAVDHSREPAILHIGVMYSIAVAAGAVARSGVGTLVEGISHGSIGSVGRRLFVLALLLVLVGGAMLALPVCWEGEYPVTGDNTYPGQARLEIVSHLLNCLFTAAAAVTSTGLAVSDIGYEFSRVGHVVILGLMQIGALAVLTIGAAVGWRLRYMIGWEAPDDDVSPAGLRRLIRFVVVAAVLIELAGTAALYRTWDAGVDADFAAACQRPELFGGVLRRVPGLEDRYDEARLLASLFHAVSAFGNAGLTLTRDSLTDYGTCTAIYAAILPLMVLGSIGGPVGYELCRRLTRRGGHGLSWLSKDSRITLLATVGLILLGAALLWGIESTHRWQLRYPRGQTPGRLEVSSSTSPTAEPPGAIVFSSQQAAGGEQMRAMPPRQRAGAAVWHSIAARTGGMQTARLDESSLSPASRLVLMIWMLIGGAVGGCAGGLRIGICVLLIRAITFRMTREHDQPAPRALPIARQRAIISATAVAALMLTLIAGVTFVLVYRTAGSFEGCLFEAISASCNVGFSTGLTSQLADLSLQNRAAGESALILAMLLGRVLPLAVLLRLTYWPRG